MATEEGFANQSCESGFNKGWELGDVFKSE